MGSVAKILAIIDPGVDGLAAREVLRQSCQGGEMVIVDQPDLLPDVLKTQSWSAILHCGVKNSDAVQLIGQLRPDLAVVTLDVADPYAVADLPFRSPASQSDRFAPDIDAYPQPSSRTVVWSAIAISVAISIGGWFLTGRIISVNEADRNGPIANEDINDLDDFSTAAGKNGED